MNDKQLIQKLRSALERLVDCPDLNLDNLEGESEQALDEANSALVAAMEMGY